MGLFRDFRNLCHWLHYHVVGHCAGSTLHEHFVNWSTFRLFFLRFYLNKTVYCLFCSVQLIANWYQILDLQLKFCYQNFKLVIFPLFLIINRCLNTIFLFICIKFGFYFFSLAQLEFKSVQFFAGFHTIYLISS